MNRSWRLIVWVVIGAAAIYGARILRRAQANLVSLKVREADVREVVDRVASQTWETIHLEPGVQGKVTLNVQNVPLEEVLRIVGQQTASQWSAVYPLYTSSASLAQLMRVVRGELPAAQSSWKAWSEAAALAVFGRFADALREENERVTARFQGKDVEFVALALSRFSRARVLPEDGTGASIDLQFSQTPLAEAVAQLARQAGRRWTVFYVLEPGRFANRPSAGDEQSSNAVSRAMDLVTGASRRGEGKAETDSRSAPEREEAIAKRFAARLATMNPAESNRAVEMHQQAEAVRRLPPEQRRDALRQLLANPEAQNRAREVMMQRITDAIRDSTPEQRVERSRALLELRRRLTSRPPSAP